MLLEFLGRLMGVIMKKARDRQWERQRAIDLEILWPICKEQAQGDMDKAKAAFAVHAFNDPAWVRHYEDRLYRVIEELT